MLLAIKLQLEICSTETICQQNHLCQIPHMNTAKNPRSYLSATFMQLDANWLPLQQPMSQLQEIQEPTHAQEEDCLAGRKTLVCRG
jgi:hypothetical protein